MRRRWRSVAIALVVGAVGCLGTMSPAGATNWKISVSPNTGLTDGQSVVVTGTGFTEHPLTQFVVGWAVAECSDAVLLHPLDPVLVTNSCDITSTPFRFVHFDAAGSFSTTFRVATRFTPGIGGVPIDCTKTPCALVVAQITDAGFVGAATPISFAPQTPAAAVDRLHNVARFTGSGVFSGRDHFTFDVTVVDNHSPATRPDRIAVEIRDPENVMVYSSSGLRQVRDGDIVIGS
jgi:hypothetical protein